MLRMSSVFLTAVFMSASYVLAAPAIVADKAVHEFGQMDNRQVVEHTFVLTNKGDEDLHITQVKPACGCTAAALAKNVLVPGDSVDLRVGLSLKDTKGQHRKEIAIESNDPRNPKLVLMMVGEATSPVTVSPSHLLFGEVSPASSASSGQVAEFSSQRANQPDSTMSGKLIRHVMVTLEDQLPLRVTRTEILSDHHHAGEDINDARWAAAVEENNASSENAGDSGVFRVRVELTPGTSLGQARTTVRLHTDNADYPRIDIPVSAVVISDINVSPQSIVLMESNASPVTRYVMVTLGQNRQETDFQIIKVTPPLPEIGVEVRPMGRRGYRIKLADMIPTPDMADTKVVIETNIESMRRIEIPVRVMASQNQAAAR